MNKLNIVLLIIAFGVFTSCNKEEVSTTSLIPEDLTGYWEANNTSIQFMLGNHYCNSFELRENNEFAIYYSNQDKPSNTRIDGIWSITEEDKIEFFFNPNNIVIVQVMEILESEMVIIDSDFEILLNRN